VGVRVDPEVLYVDEGDGPYPFYEPSGELVD